ncbi:arylsulfatase, partial [candidate division KSB1 bacterium]
MKDNFDRRRFLKTAGVGIATLGIPAFINWRPKTYKKPNIIWLIAEDVCPDFRCYGTTLVKTPNIDKLADEGIRFTNAFSTGAVCSPSRSAFNTGMYQTSIGAHQHRTKDKEPLPDNVKMISEYLRSAGYFVCNGYGNPGSRPGKQDFNFKVDHPFDGTDWSQRENGQSFFAQIQIRMSHRPFKRDYENPVNPDKVEIPPYYPDHPITRMDWALYLETNQLLDKRIGEIINRLRKERLLNNSVIFFFGDHGRAHIRGKQFLYDGGIHIPLIVRWPDYVKQGTVNNDPVSLIDIVPACLKIAGIDIPDYMQGRDFLDRNSKKRGYIVAARDRCDETVDRIRCFRTGRYKYIRNFYPDRPYTQGNVYKKRMYPVLTLMRVLYSQGKLKPEQARFMAPNRPEEELYDLQNDPFEINNLADRQEYSNVLTELRNKLKKWMETSKDQGEIPESAETLQYWKKEAENRWKRVQKKRGLPVDISDDEYLK